MQNQQNFFTVQPVCHSGCSIYKKDYETIKPYQWLNATAIQLLTRLLDQQYNNKKIRVIDVFISEMLIYMGDEDCLLSLQKNKYFDHSYLLIPLNGQTNPHGKGNHWYLLIYDVIKHKLNVLDSVSGSNGKREYQATKVMKQRLQQMHFLYKKEKISIKIFHITKIPNQKNTFDCGIFTIGFVEQFFKYFSSDNEQRCIENFHITEQFEHHREKYRNKMKDFIKKYIMKQNQQQNTQL